MAHRSYLYSADELPKGPPSGAVRCISEHNWSIPFGHKVLVGYGTRVVESWLFGNQIGIAGDYAPGADLLLRLLRLVGEGEIPDREWFDKLLLQVEQHLEVQRARYFVLETGELLEEMTDFRRLVDQEIPHAVRLAETLLAGGKQEELAGLRANWLQHFDSFYSDFLYFTFNQH
jgi:hypothetical protein